jgi:flavin-dependent dehydrogenase
MTAVVAALGFLAPPARAADEKQPAYDIVVYGGTSGGVAAAVQAARMGKKVVLIEPSEHIGGLSSGGLGATDIGNKAAIGGIAREFYQRVKKHYDAEAAWRWQKAADYHSGRQAGREDTMWTFEPHVAEKIFREMLKEAKVTVVLGERVERNERKPSMVFWTRPKSDENTGLRIAAITMESGRSVRGRTFIDASYEGDLMAVARLSPKVGVSYTIGR